MKAKEVEKRDKELALAEERSANIQREGMLNFTWREKNKEWK